MASYTLSHWELLCSASINASDGVKDEVLVTQDMVDQSYKNIGVMNADYFGHMVKNQEFLERKIDALTDAATGIMNCLNTLSNFVADSQIKTASAVPGKSKAEELSSYMKRKADDMKRKNSECLSSLRSLSSSKRFCSSPQYEPPSPPPPRFLPPLRRWHDTRNLHIQVDELDRGYSPTSPQYDPTSPQYEPTSAQHDPA